MTIAVDFDGVLTPNGHWPNTGEPNEKLINWLIMFREMGGKVILWTNRNGKALEAAVEFCRYNGLEFDAINENLPEILEQFGEDSRKITADLYIDDKACKQVFIKGKLDER